MKPLKQRKNICTESNSPPRKKRSKRKCFETDDDEEEEMDTVTKGWNKFLPIR